MRKALLITLLVLLGAVNATAGPADPPTLPTLPEPGQVVGISRFSVADIQKLPNPGNPPTGLIRLYADSTTGNLTCLTSTGASCLSGGGGSTAFSSLTSGTNTTAAMVVGSGASLGVSGTGTIAATSCGGTTTQLLFNDGGVCGSSASLAFNKTLATLGVGLGFSDGTLASDIGFTSTANSPLSLLVGTHITDTVNASNHFAAGGGFGCEYTGSATLTNSSCVGLYFQALQNGPGAIGVLAGINGLGYNEVGTILTEVHGVVGQAENDGTAPIIHAGDFTAYSLGTTTDRNIGVYTAASTLGGTVPLNLGIEIANANFGGNVTVENAGLYVHDIHGISSGGVNYGIHILNQGTGAGDWAIKVDGGKVELSDAVILDGTTSGTGTLGVAAVAGTPNRINLPTATGASGNLLLTNGANPQQSAWSTGLTWNTSTKSLTATGTGASHRLSSGASDNDIVQVGPSTVFVNALQVGATLSMNGDAQADLDSNAGIVRLAFTQGVVQIGANGSASGHVLNFKGGTSGTAGVGVADVAGTPNQINLPTTTGSSQDCLKTDGASPQQTSWGTCSTTTGTVTSVATTGPITGGTITSTGTIACATCGVTGSPLSQFASTTSLQLAGVISDETGSGALVFATTPTLVTPVIGAATGTSLVLSAQLTSAALSASGLGTFTGAGAASTNSVKFNGTLFTGGSGTTTFPNVYIDPGGANTQPTTWSTNGTLLGLNAPTGFTGKMLDVHLNGGSSLFSIDQAGGMAVSTIASSAGITAAAGSNLGLNGRTQLRSAADGRITINNNANASLGMTRVSFGTEAATNPAFAPLNTILDVVDGAGTSTLGNTTLLSANGNKVFVTTNFTTAANTNLQTITGLTFNFSAVAHNWNFSCHLAYSQATGTAAVAFGIQAATNNPTNIFATGELFTAAGTVTTGTLATLATTTATNIVSGTPGATATNNVVDLYGTLELAASANAVNIMVSTATSGDAVTVLRGSSCQLF